MTRNGSANCGMWARAAGLITMLLFLSGSAENHYSQQSEPSPQEKPTTQNLRERDRTENFGELLVKQQISRRRKEHEELLKRAEDALKISEELHESISTNESLTSIDVEKLQSLEKIVARIRKDIGGDDEKEYLEDSSSQENSARRSMGAAIEFLRDATKSLVDELKRTSRFSISALAIQTSNTLIRFIRFLKLKK